MALTPGARVGVYEISVLLGAGGMGEVYRARDTKLNRDVAIKVLLPEVANDPERLARFSREAQTLAALNHPNIAHIHGLEDGAIIMELVDGEDLASQIARGPLPIDEALPIARQIAEALEAAHEQVIVHRDLKPANIKVRSDGTVKVLDFGLAKALETAGGIRQTADGKANSPTITSPAMTQMGMILGTAAYMSPEQARGKSVDKRADTWAFGCVLFEMLTGRRAFAGDDISDVLASVLARDIDFSALPAATPPSIRRLLRRCLQKDRNDRLRDIGDARLEIADAIARSEVDATTVPVAVRGRRWPERLAWIGALAAVTLAAAWILLGRPNAVVSERRLDIWTPPTPAPSSLAISPDGRTLAFVASDDGQSRLWLRSLETGSSRAVAGTDGAEWPFWSPDSRSVGFFADGKIRRVDVDGGSVQTLGNATRGGGGGTWNEQGVILFASLGAPIARIPATGGESVALQRLALQGSDFSPWFLPDGRRFLYYVRGNPEVRGVYVGQLDESLEPRRLLDADSGAVYAWSGHLLFGRQQTLYAQRFDLDRLVLTGNPFPVAEGLGNMTGFTVSVSRAGAVVFRGMSASAERRFIWFDRSGREIEKVGDPVSTVLSQPSLSPDGQRIAFYRGGEANPDIWILDSRRGALSRFTSDPADDVFPVWSPDGTRLVFSSNRKGTHELYVKSLSGGSDEPLFAAGDFITATDWSKDGRFVLFINRNPKRSVDLWALALDGRKSFPVAQSAFDEEFGQFSPDGHWIAYQSNESGRAEIYVQSFPEAGNKSLVSTNGGTQVRWSRDGKELFYVDRNGQLTAVPIRLGSSMQAPDVGRPVALFAPPLGTAVQQGDDRHQYMLSPDGQRILIATVAEGLTAPISIILNWRPRE